MIGEVYNNPNKENLVQGTSNNLLKKTNKNNNRCNLCCMLTTIGISSIAGGIFSAVATTCQLIYTYDVTLTTKDIIVSCALTGTAGAIGMGVISGIFVGLCYGACSEQPSKKELI